MLDPVFLFFVSWAVSSSQKPHSRTKSPDSRLGAEEELNNRLKMKQEFVPVNNIYMNIYKYMYDLYTYTNRLVPAI